MFGKPQRGVSERPVKRTEPLIPKWLWSLFAIVLLIFAMLMLMLWRPWQPVQADPLAESATTAEAPPTADEFRFYDLLPKQQVVPIPQQALPNNAPNPTEELSNPPEATAAISESEPGVDYILQIRSYPDPDQADARRAEIIMSGLSADVLTVDEGDKTWYRVISGPYSNEQAALSAQQRLQNSGIDSIIVKQNNANPN